MDALTEGLHLGGSIVDLTKDILDRADRDGPAKEYNEKIVKIQNAFAHNDLDSDEFRTFVDKLCNDAGHPLTPTRDVPTGKREYLHSSLTALAELGYAKKIIAKLIAQRTK